MKHLGLLLSSLLLAACPKVTSTSTPTGGAPAGGAATAGAPIAGTMAEAPTQAFPSTLDVSPDCNQAGYFVLAVAEGQAFSINASVSAGCAMIAVMKANGSTNDMPSKEVCADAPQTIESVGQAEKTFITLHETGACVGNAVTLAMQ